jgi:hypothetical protein
MKFRAAHVGATRRVFQCGLAQTFELAAADVLQLDAVGARCGSAVEVNRDTEPAPNLKSRLTRKHRHFERRDAGDRDEGDDVGGSDTRMNASLPGEVDQLRGFANRANRGFDYRTRFTRYGYDGAMVIAIQ